MNIDEAGLELIKSFEGFRSEPYQDQHGVWTIGYGHTHDVSSSWLPITEEQGEDYLREDLQPVETAIAKFITVPLNQNEYNALASFAFNEGIGSLITSTLAKLLNHGDRAGAAVQFGHWVYVRDETGEERVDEGLERRRELEAKLFLTPVAIAA